MEKVCEGVRVSPSCMGLVPFDPFFQGGRNKSKPREGPSNSAGASILDVPAFRSIGNKCVLFLS